MTHSDDRRETFSPREVARLLGIGERQAREWINAGGVYHFRIGRRVLVPRRALEQVLSGPSPIRLDSGDTGETR